MELGPEVMVGHLAREKLDRPRGDLVHVDAEAWVRMTAEQLSQARAWRDPTQSGANR